MSTLPKGMVTAAAVVAAAGAGLWAGQVGLVKLPIVGTTGMASMTSPAGTGPVVYYRDPDGKPLYSLTPKTTDSGRPYVEVHASEDIRFDTPKAVARATGADQGERKPIYYRNPMGLPDTSPVPKKDSMGMDYIPVYEGEQNDGNTITVSPGKIQRTGVKTEAIAKRAISRNIHAPGVVAIDERRITVVAPRFDGFIDKVGPVTSGTHVRKGEPLMTVFGQELLNQAARLLVEGYSGPSGDAGGTSSRLKDNLSGVIGARRRLLNFGVPEEFIEQVQRDRKVPDTISWPAPQDGVVLERNAVNGQGFKAGDVLFRIADHSVVWVMADVAEGDIGALKAGQSVKVTTRAHPGRVFNGTVSVVYPHLMKETRTVRVRIELPNPDLALLPDMYTEVDIATGSDEPVIAVPESAVIDSGARQVVIVDQGDGRFEPREVKLGRKGDGYVEVTSGVQYGESVVVNGNFLIDAESNLQAALKGLGAPRAEEAHQ
jgi:Cu(I)/Ag(I) efflux system membrane fusion protein